MPSVAFGSQVGELIGQQLFVYARCQLANLQRELQGRVRPLAIAQAAQGAQLLNDRILCVVPDDSVLRRQRKRTDE